MVFIFFFSQNMYSTFAYSDMQHVLSFSIFSFTVRWENYQGVMYLIDSRSGPSMIFYPRLMIDQLSLSHDQISQSPTSFSCCKLGCRMPYLGLYCRSDTIREVLIFANFATRINTRIQEFRENYYYNTATKE